MTGTPNNCDEQRDYSTPTGECDLVMEGGITSGVVYPLAACHLAQKYRLRSIGGTSVGAIAAVLAAAAEHGRNSGGFETLEDLPRQVGTRLEDLFQAPKPTRPAMKVLLGWLTPSESMWVKVAAALGQLVVQRLWMFLAATVGFTFLCLLPVAGVTDWSDVLGAFRLSYLPVVVVGLIIGLVVAAASLLMATLKRFPANFYGLTTGMGEEGKQGFTEWLHQRIQETAGRTGHPLTFGDLWATNGGTPEDPGVKLEMITSDLTEGLPYRMPFAENDLAYCSDCLRRLFPSQVVDHMIDKSGPMDGRPTCVDHPDTELQMLPKTEDLPVLVAMRMSLSFPILICAVPLYKYDMSRAEAARSWIRHWFSDGGIGSNLPIHFFDAMWPSRPTFAIDLQDQHPDYDNKVFWHDHEDKVAPRTYEITSVIGFLGRVFHTMQKWKDRSLALVPGYSDRIVRVYLDEDEGGMNLRMPEPLITELSCRGLDAAKELDRFQFEHHRWNRYRTSMAELDRVLGTMERRYEPGIADFIAHPPVDFHNPLEYACNEVPVAWHEVDQDNTRALMDVAGKWSERCNAAGAEAPSPRPILRMEPSNTGG